MIHMYRVFIICCLLLLFTGCDAETDTANDSKFINLSTTQSIDQHDSNHAKQILSKHEEMTNIYAVSNSKNMIIAFEVYHHDRLQLKKIKKTIEKQINKEFPNLDIIVSTDKKIILELHELENKIEQNSISKDKINKKVEQLMTLAKEQT